MKHTFLTIFIAFVLAMTGCTSMNKDECSMANWHAIGQQDAEEGKSASNLVTYNKQCAKHSIAPNKDEYSAGHQAGAIIYCTKENGFSQGKKGKKYQGICPTDLAKVFNSGYVIGKEYYAVLSIKSTYETQISSKNKKIKKLVKQVKNITEKLADSKMKPEDKKQLRIDRVGKGYEANQLAIEVQNIRPKLAVQEYKYSELVKKYGYL
jgi:hypothetical protein